MRSLLLACAVALAGCSVTAALAPPPELPEVSVPLVETYSFHPNVLVRRAPSATGPIDRHGAGLALARNSGHFAACHEAADPGIAGNGVVYLVLDVDAPGRVRRVTIGHSDIRSSRFERCLRDALSELALPAAEAGSVVQTHIVFGAADQNEARRMLQTYRGSRATEPSGVSTARAPLEHVRDRIEACYQRALRSQPELRTRMVLRLTLASDGRVTDATFDANRSGDSLAGCIRRGLRDMRLETAETNAVTLLYPVVLEPGMR